MLQIFNENIQIGCSAVPRWNFLLQTILTHPQKLQQLQPRRRRQQQVKKLHKHEALIRWSARHDSSITAPARCKRARIYIGFPSDLGAE